MRLSIVYQYLDKTAENASKYELVGLGPTKMSALIRAEIGGVGPN